MRIEQEGRYAECQNGNPEVRAPTCTERQSDIEQHHQGPHSEIDTRAGEPREQDAERVPRGGEATSGGNVPCTTKSQVAHDGVRRDLGREDFENR